jgi:hypothetical protein
MLNTNLDECSGTSETPHSIFDLKQGNNPTGAAIPKWFKSIQAPQVLVPEDQHIPFRKEYGVKHIKQNWIEPK